MLFSLFFSTRMLRMQLANTTYHRCARSPINSSSWRFFFSADLVTVSALRIQAHSAYTGSSCPTVRWLFSRSVRPGLP